MILEDYQPEPSDETIAKSRLFFIELVKRTKSDVERAEARLEDALQTYDDDNFEGGTVIREAEINLSRCEAAYNSAVAHAEWESSRSFAKQITPLMPMLAPWNDSPKLWLSIFEHYKRNK